MLSVITLSIIMRSVIMLSVIMLSVIMPLKPPETILDHSSRSRAIYLVTHQT
jgi:hypothetical protein